MKSRIKFLPLLAIISGLLLSAFSTEALQKGNVTEPKYSFVRLSDNLIVTETIEDAEILLGCQGSSIICAEAFEENYPNETQKRIRILDLYQD